jgi:aminopeptidase N
LGKTALTKLTFFKSIKKSAEIDNYRWTRTQFETTVKMSTYLVAILVSDYDCRNDTAITPLSLKVNVSVCARPNKYDELDRALNASLYFVGFFETLFDNKYPLPKLGK